MSKEDENIKKLGTESYKGVRDFYPEDQFIQNYIFKIWKETSEKYGFVEYNASILESTELYKAKSGEEIINDQTYSFIDRGEREVTLRPEMTPTAARMVAAKRRELSFPLRWYSIPNLFRYERPQRGRLREHWQLNCDIFGVESSAADIEIIVLAYNLMKAFGAKDEDFSIKINSRKILNKTLKDAGIKDEQAYKLQKLLDRKNKTDKFNEEAALILGRPYDLKFEIDKDLSEIISELDKLGITNVSFDPDLVRGFDYYTGTVFEVYDTNNLNNRSLFGGGRFNDLIALFGEENISAIGFGMGDVTIKDFLLTRKLLPQYISPTALYIVNAGASISKLISIAEEIRKENINVAVDLSSKKIGDQIKKAVNDKIPYIAVIGEIELASKEIKIKELKTEKEEKVSLNQIGKYLKNKLSL